MARSVGAESEIGEMVGRVLRPGWMGPLGPLEYSIMTVLWSQGPATARDLRRHFSRAAYTTLMTTLDRLYKKGLLHRQQQGRSNTYWPTMTRPELQVVIVGCILKSEA